MIAPVRAVPRAEAERSQERGPDRIHGAPDGPHSPAHGASDGVRGTPHGPIHSLLVAGPGGGASAALDAVIATIIATVATATEQVKRLLQGGVRPPAGPAPAGALAAVAIRAVGVVAVAAVIVGVAAVLAVALAVALALALDHRSCCDNTVCYALLTSTFF